MSAREGARCSCFSPCLIAPRPSPLPGTPITAEVRWTVKGDLLGTRWPVVVSLKAIKKQEQLLTLKTATLRGLRDSQSLTKARFKRRATAVPSSIDRIKFDFSTTVARRLKPSRATAVPNSIHKL